MSEQKIVCRWKAFGQADTRCPYHESTGVMKCEYCYEKEDEYKPPEKEMEKNEF